MKLLCFNYDVVKIYAVGWFFFQGAAALGVFSTHFYLLYIFLIKKIKKTINKVRYIKNY